MFWLFLKTDQVEDIKSFFVTFFYQTLLILPESPLAQPLVYFFLAYRPGPSAESFSLTFFWLMCMRNLAAQMVRAWRELQNKKVVTKTNWGNLDFFHQQKSESELKLFTAQCPSCFRRTGPKTLKPAKEGTAVSPETSALTSETLECQCWPEHLSIVFGWLRSKSLYSVRKIPEGRVGSQLPWHQEHLPRDQKDWN